MNYTLQETEVISFDTFLFSRAWATLKVCSEFYEWFNLCIELYAKTAVETK